MGNHELQSRGGSQLNEGIIKGLATDQGIVLTLSASLMLENKIIPTISSLYQVYLGVQSGISLLDAIDEVGISKNGKKNEAIAPEIASEIALISSLGLFEEIRPAAIQADLARITAAAGNMRELDAAMQTAILQQALAPDVPLIFIKNGIITAMSFIPDLLYGTVARRAMTETADASVVSTV